MSVDTGAEQPGAKHSEAAPSLPLSIWVVAWASLAGQAVLWAREGVRRDDEVSLAVSVVLGALLVGYVSAGVVRARAVRLAVAWVVLVLSLIAELISLVSADHTGEVALLTLSLATTVLALAGLATFRRTEWYAWQPTRPSTRDGAPIGRLVAIGVLVGASGGLIGPVDDGLDVRISAAPCMCQPADPASSRSPGLPHQALLAGSSARSRG